jgi:hypothetical protein
MILAGADGKKLLGFLNNQQWKVQALSLLAILATKGIATHFFRCHRFVLQAD